MIRVSLLLASIFSFLSYGLSLKVLRSAQLVQNGPITFPFAKRINSTSVKDVLKVDRARAAARLARFGIQPNIPSVDSIGRRDTIEEAVDDQAVMYVASVGVGSPATIYSLIIDTGTSNTWLGAGKAYVQTNASSQTSNQVSVSYGSGSFNGTEFLDTVSLGSSFVVQQSIGVASTSQGFEGVDGVLGLGPDDLTLDTLSPNSSSEIPTLTDEFSTECQSDSEVIGIFFEPTTSEDALNGAITFGGVALDIAEKLGAGVTVPITEVFPSNRFWGIDQGIVYGNLQNITILDTTAGILDSGTTLLLIATDAFQRYITASGAILDSGNTGLLTMPKGAFSSLQSLFFLIDNIFLEFTANAQAWPRALNTLIGGTTDNVYLIIADLGTPSGVGLDFINGFTFLERFFTEYDSTRGEISIVSTEFTGAETN